MAWECLRRRVARLGSLPRLADRVHSILWEGGQLASMAPA